MTLGVTLGSASLAPVLCGGFEHSRAEVCVETAKNGRLRNRVRRRRFRVPRCPRWSLVVGRCVPGPSRAVGRFDRYLYAMYALYATYALQEKSSPDSLLRERTRRTWRTARTLAHETCRRPREGLPTAPVGIGNDHRERRSRDAPSQMRYALTADAARDDAGGKRTASKHSRSHGKLLRNVDRHPDGSRGDASKVCDSEYCSLPHTAFVHLAF